MPNVFCGDDSTPLAGRIGIVVSRYNENITRRLLQGALDTLATAGVADDAIDVCWVPGAWELPVVAQELARDGRYAAVVCLGSVIRGETTHDEHINRQVSLSLGQIALDARLPVAFGVLTCNSLEQALQRAGGNVGNKGCEATTAALEMARLLVRVRQLGRTDDPLAVPHVPDAATSTPTAEPAAKSYHSERRGPDSPDHDDRAEKPTRIPRPMFPAADDSTAASHTPPSPPGIVASETVVPGTVEPASGPIPPPGDSRESALSAPPAVPRRGPRIRRRRGRAVVLQMLYADDINPNRNMADADAFLRRRLSFDPALVQFACDLLAGVRRNRAELDQRLARQATNWSLQRMAATDRNVLRLGVYEILFTDTPRVVVINEAVDLARRYGSRQSAQFVNGILDRFNADRRNTPAE